MSFLFKSSDVVLPIMKRSLFLVKRLAQVDADDSGIDNDDAGEKVQGDDEAAPAQDRFAIH